MLLFFFFSFFFENVLLNFCIEKQLRCKKNYNLKDIHFFKDEPMIRWLTCQRKTYKNKNKKGTLGGINLNTLMFGWNHLICP